MIKRRAPTPKNLYKAARMTLSFIKIPADPEPEIKKNKKHTACCYAEHVSTCELHNCQLPYFSSHASDDTHACQVQMEGQWHTVYRHFVKPLTKKNSRLADSVAFCENAHSATVFNMLQRHWNKSQKNRKNDTVPWLSDLTFKATTVVIKRKVSAFSLLSR